MLDTCGTGGGARVSQEKEWELCRVNTVEKRENRLGSTDLDATTIAREEDRERTIKNTKRKYWNDSQRRARSPFNDLRCFCNLSNISPIPGRHPGS